MNEFYEVLQLILKDFFSNIGAVFIDQFYRSKICQ